MIEGKVITNIDFVPEIFVMEDYVPKGPARMRGVKIMCNGLSVTVPMVALPELLRVMESYLIHPYPR